VTEQSGAFEGRFDAWRLDGSASAPEDLTPADADEDAVPDEVAEVEADPDQSDAESVPDEMSRAEAGAGEVHPDAVPSQDFVIEPRTEARTPEVPAPRTEVAPSKPAPSGEKQTLALVTPEELRPALEAILLVVDEPVAEVVLAQILERPTEEIAAAMQALSAEYTEAGRGFDLRRAAGGWRLYTRTEYAAYVERFVLDGQHARLTQAALETLAVVAYKQPVTRSRISAIRGVAVDGVIRTLLTRGLISECGAEPDTGAHLYRTTTLFLEKLGLDTVDELPPLAPLLPDLESLDDGITSP
jgi:segregation and condensation protein B